MHKVIPAFTTGRISQEKADQLISKIKQVNDGSLHVFFSDERPHYRKAILKFFGQWTHPKRKGKRGRFPKRKLLPPEGLIYAQVVKHRRRGRVVKITQRVIFGTREALEEYLRRSPVNSRVNTAFVERQNETMRHHNRRFMRKTLSFSKEMFWLSCQLHLCIGYYHFCLPHSSLRVELTSPLSTKGGGSPKKWCQITPAMSIGVTDRVWTLKELLTYIVPPEIN